MRTPTHTIIVSMYCALGQVILALEFLTLGDGGGALRVLMQGARRKLGVIETWAEELIEKFWEQVNAQEAMWLNAKANQVAELAFAHQQRDRHSFGALKVSLDEGPVRVRRYDATARFVRYILAVAAVAIFFCRTEELGRCKSECFCASYFEISVEELGHGLDPAELATHWLAVVF